MQTRLALDVGSSSLGWILYELIDGIPARIIDGGVRIFGDGREAKTGQSLAVGRRGARADARRPGTGGKAGRTRPPMRCGRTALTTFCRRHIWAGRCST